MENMYLLTFSAVKTEKRESNYKELPQSSHMLMCSRKPHTWTQLGLSIFQQDPMGGCYFS